MTNWNDEFWRAQNPGLSVMRGVTAGVVAGLTVWAAAILTVAVIW